MLNLPFQESPPMVRKAIVALPVAWISLMAFLYHVHQTFPGAIGANHAGRAAIAGAAICYFVFRIKPWARILCIFFNLAIIIINVLFLYIRVTSLGLESFSLSVHALVNAILFGVSTYLLIVKETASFFKAHSSKIPQAGEPPKPANQ